MPQNLGRMLWFPMWLMAAMGFGAGFVVAIIRANEVIGVSMLADDVSHRQVLKQELVQIGVR